MYNLECITLLAWESVDQFGGSPPHSLGVLRRLCKVSSLSSLTAETQVYIKFQVYNHGLIFLVTRPHPEAIQNPTKRLFIQRLSYHLGGSNGFRSPVSGTKVKEQIFEQKIFLAPLPYRKLQEF